VEYSGAILKRWNRGRRVPDSWKIDTKIKMAFDFLKLKQKKSFDKQAICGM